MSAAQEKCFQYARRRPELSTLYKVLQQHLASFVANREAEGRPLPEYVKEEFEAFLRCGILAHGFLRLKCTSCSQEKIVAFSCKKRGFCPSCTGKRMAEAASHLVENVLPMVPYRQYVISFPIPMRYWMQFNKKLYAKVHSLVIKELHRYYKDKALKLGIKDPTPGSISFTQRFGSACNLNLHMHVICPDGVYTTVGDGARFRNLQPITDEEVAGLIAAISQKVMAYLTKQGYLDKDGEIVLNPMVDEIFEENQTISVATRCSIDGKIAFGPNAGKYVTRVGSGFGFGEETPLAKGKRCYSINGFSLHANTATNTHQRDKLRKIISYSARGPISNKRLSQTEDGKIKLELKTRWADGTTHLLFTPEEFIEKLVALIPPPKTHLVRWAGCFAPNSPYRKKITLKPEVKKAFQFKNSNEDENVKNYSWSKMLAKVFKIDVTKCDCGGDLVKVCSVMARDAIKKYLSHIGIDHNPPARAPPRTIQPNLEFDPQEPPYEEPTVMVEGSSPGHDCVQNRRLSPKPPLTALFAPTSRAKKDANRQ